MRLSGALLSVFRVESRSVRPAHDDEPFVPPVVGFVMI